MDGVYLCPYTATVDGFANQQSFVTTLEMRVRRVRAGPRTAIMFSTLGKPIWGNNTRGFDQVAWLATQMMAGISCVGAIYFFRSRRPRYLVASEVT
jgi:hypothetical protein